MSHEDCPDPAPGDARAAAAIEAVIIPRARDLGGFEVRRALPSARRQMVGPFIFWDQMGPAEFLLGQGLDVRPHPHIGLATVTYLFRGAIHHRDSLGTSLDIEPGALNVMTAGRGIVHSERTPGPQRALGTRMFGIQAWVALPAAREEDPASFTHHAAATLPVVEGGGARVRVMAGALLGARSPVELATDTLYADAELAPGAVIPFDAAAEERAIYTAEGEIEVAGDVFGPGQLLVLRPGDVLTIRARTAARIMLLGGAAMDGPRHIWWNFVSSRKDRIEQAKADWAAGRFDAVPGESEWIPLPER